MMIKKFTNLREVLDYIDAVAYAELEKRESLRNQTEG